MRAWDILPPTKKHKVTKSEVKRKKRSSVYFVFFLVLIAAFFIVFLGAGKLPNPSSSPSAATAPTNSPDTSVSGSKTQNKISIKILNGTGRVEETQKVQKTLNEAGFNISITENALNLYDQTIIYYQAPMEPYANQISTLLQVYNAKVQKFTQETKYDIVVVIGTK